MRRAKRVSNPFYNSAEWIKLSHKFRSENRWCIKCLNNGRYTPTDDVDHIRPIKQFPNLAFSEDNLQPLCKKCHVDKTKRDRAGRYYDFVRRKVYE